MNVQNDLRVDGTIHWWSLTEFSSLRKLADGFELAGFADACPQPLGDPAALRRSLTEMFRGHLVQRLKDEDAFEVREVIRGKDENIYAHKLTARIVRQNDATELAIHPYDQEVADTLASKFSDARGLVPYARVTSALVTILRRLGGKGLSQGGGIYWLPGHQLPALQPVIGTVESAAIGGHSNVYVIRHQFDQDAIKAVRDAVVNDITRTAQTIMKEVASGTLGGRALENRLAQANHLREEIAEYERLLDCGLGDLRRLADEAETAATTASLLCSV